MRRIGSAFALLLCLLSGFGYSLAQTGHSDQFERDFAQANQLYLHGDYPTATQIYERLRVQAPHSAVVFYNLANAYAQNEEVGPAVLYYRRALLLAPRDRDIISNLEHIERQLAYQPSPDIDNWIAVMLGGLRERVTINELAVINAALYWLAIGMAIWFLHNRRRLLSFLLAISLLLCCISTMFSYSKWQRDYAGDRAIVLSDGQMYSGPGEHFEPLMRLGAGTEVKMLQPQGRYREIQTSAGGRGWLSGEQVQLISPFIDD